MTESGQGREGRSPSPELPVRASESIALLLGGPETHLAPFFHALIGTYWPYANLSLELVKMGRKRAEKQRGMSSTPRATETGGRRTFFQT